MSNFSISIRPFGIHAVLIEWPNEVNEEILEDILHFKVHLEIYCLDATVLFGGGKIEDGPATDS